MRIKIAKLSAIAFSVASVLSMSHWGASAMTRAGDQGQDQSQIDMQLSDKLQLVAQVAKERSQSDLQLSDKVLPVAQEQSQIDVLGRGSTVAERIGTDD